VKIKTDKTGWICDATIMGLMGFDKAGKVGLFKNYKLA